MKRVAFTGDKRLCNGSMVEHGGEFYVCVYERYARSDKAYLSDVPESDTERGEYIGEKYIGR